MSGSYRTAALPTGVWVEGLTVVVHLTFERALLAGGAALAGDGDRVGAGCTLGGPATHHCRTLNRKK